VNFTHAVGKVFYTNPKDGKDYQCSASSINSAKRRLVWTAGHCVHGGPGGNWMTNWAFEPGYQRGTGPNGVFSYYQLWAQSGWWADGDTHFDYGVGITWNNAAGRRIGDAVGGNGLIVNPGRPFVTAIGYPSNVLEGETQSYCQATLSRRSLFNSDQELPCDRRQGASGEPFLKDYNNDTGLGYIVSNGSYIIGNGNLYGPYYDNDTRALYDAAENASPP
jgi:V8-like Glu-specific endopeptidase